MGHPDVWRRQLLRFWLRQNDDSGGTTFAVWKMSRSWCNTGPAFQLRETCSERWGLERGTWGIAPKGLVMKTNLSKYLATSLLAMGLVATASAQYGGYPPHQPQVLRAWDAPPQEFREFERRGFLDGVQGAQRDAENHRIWNVNNRDEYRHAHVPGEMRHEYREGFERGYYATVQHFEGVRGR